VEYIEIQLIIKQLLHIGCRCLLVLSLFARFGANGKAQEPVFSQFMFNQLYFNPAFAGNTQYPRLSAGYRNQWAGLGNAYVTYYASYDQFFEKMNGGLGLGFSRDLQGSVFSRTSADFVYSYRLKWRKTIIMPGIQTSLVQNLQSAGSLTLADRSPFSTSGSQENISNRSQIFPDFSFGISFFMKEQYQVNLSVHHINYMRGKSFDTNFSALPTYFNVQVLGTTKPKKDNRMTDRVIVKPALSCDIKPESQSLQWGANIFYTQFFGGLWLRNTLPISYNTFIFTAGYTFNGLSLGYSFDWWVPVTHQNFSFLGSHEVTLVYLFKYNDPKKRMKPVNCPNFYENLDEH
jgi:type IX secretion system PorP/SprF family membrane protein